MGLRLKYQESESCFFVTTGVYEAIEASLAYYLDKYKGRMVAYVLMPTHLHLVILMQGGELGAFMRDFKKYTAQQALRELGIRLNPVWESRYDRVAIFSERILRTKIRYVLENPVRAGLCKRPEDWKWSSAAATFRLSTARIPICLDV